MRSTSHNWLCRIAFAVLIPVHAVSMPAIAASSPADAVAEHEARLAEFSRRLSALPDRDLASATRLGVWAAEHGLPEESEMLLRVVLRSQPMNEEAYHTLWDVCRARMPETVSTPYLQTRDQVSESFKVYETSHYVVFSDAGPRWTRTQADRLERAYDRYIRFANALQLRPLPIEHKLVAVVFDHRHDFATFARADGNAADPRLAGYYSPPKDRLVFYHVESDENVAEARRQLQDMQEEIDLAVRASRRARMIGRRDEARELAEGLDDRLDHLDEQEQRLNRFARQRSIAVTIHEAIHQLMFHTGVQSPYVQHPLWLTEGLATAFETDAPSSDFGPKQEFTPRRQGFYHLLDTDRLVPLRELVMADHQRSMSRSHMVNAVYHQGYALVTWMCRERRSELRDYLRALNALPSGVPSAQTQLNVFEGVFGDVDRVESAWRRYEERE